MYGSVRITSCGGQPARTEAASRATGAAALPVVCGVDGDLRESVSARHTAEDGTHGWNPGLDDPRAGSCSGSVVAGAFGGARTAGRRGAADPAAGVLWIEGSEVSGRPFCKHRLPDVAILPLPGAPQLCTGLFCLHQPVALAWVLSRYVGAARPVFSIPFTEEPTVKEVSYGRRENGDRGT